MCNSEGGAAATSSAGQPPTVPEMSVMLAGVTPTSAAVAAAAATASHDYQQQQRQLYDYAACAAAAAAAAARLRAYGHIAAASVPYHPQQHPYAPAAMFAAAAAAGFYPAATPLAPPHHHHPIATAMQHPFAKFDPRIAR